MSNKTTFNTLIQKAQTGDRNAMNELVKQNEGLIALELKAAKYADCKKDELFQEGRIGLMNAILGFDINRNTMFSTYAMPCIRQAISDALFENSRKYKVSKDFVQKVQTAKQLFNECTDQMTTSEKINRVSNLMTCSQEKATQLVNANLYGESFEGSFKRANGDDCHSKYEEDNTNLKPEDELQTKDIRETLNNALEKLYKINPKYYYAVKYHYGFYSQDSSNLSFSETGKKINASKQTTSNWEKKGLDILRNMPEIQNLAA